MKQENTSQMMTANPWGDGQLSTTTLLILLILIVIVFVGSTWFLLPTLSTVSGVQTAPSTKLPAPTCQRSGALDLPPSITEHQNDYLKCLKKEMR